jgi:hypothetical protein
MYTKTTNNIKIKQIGILNATIILLSSLMTSCNIEYVQILRTKSIGLTEKKQGWVFENDSIRINYNFNEQGGIMLFSLFNKLDKPVYLDWKNSSFIYNGEKNNYWIEESNTVGSSVQTSKVGRNAYNAFDNNLYGLSFGLLNQKTVKAERITFIPPKSGISSNIAYYQFRLTKKDLHYSVDPTKAIKIEVKDLFRKKIKFRKGYMYTYNETNSIISFRNYLALSFTENSNQFKFIDNKFYVSSLEEVDYRCVKKDTEDGKIFYITGITGYESALSRDKSK